MCCAQPEKAQPRSALRIASYNVENLFDAQDDSLKRDEGFLPESARHWDNWKVHEKVNKTAKVIRSIGGWEPPGLIGLMEVENREVLKKLKYSPPLRPAHYEMVHYPSPDERGIDVAALYQPTKLKLMHSRAVPVPLPKSDKTRDILLLSMRWKITGDTLHVLYCHWPSRYGGRQATIVKRKQAALSTRRIMDSLRNRFKDPYVLILGDFNDHWHNKSLYEHLGARPDSSGALRTGAQLINLSARENPQLGTHRYHGAWAYLDQVMVSLNLLRRKGLRIKDRRMHVVRHDFLLEPDPKYPGQRPYRTFLGMRAHGGYSDHLPIYVDLLPGRHRP